MRFAATFIAAAGFLTALPTALATITITGPSSSAYWVQDATNTITWEYTSGDPNPITITVTNPNNTYLNGQFSIAERVDLSNKFFTVTNVTLNAHPGYVVNFVNGSNITQVYAQSGTFDVKSPGTPTVSQASPSGTSPSSASGTSPSSSGNGFANSSATGSGASGTATSKASSSSKTSASLRSFDGSLMTLAPMLGLSALMSVLGALATL